jgi:hypothetical protein
LCRIGRERREQLLPINGGSGASYQCESARSEKRVEKWNARAWYKCVRTHAAVEAAAEGSAFLHDMLCDSLELQMRIGQNCRRDGPYNDGAYAALRDFNIH